MADAVQPTEGFVFRYDPSAAKTQALAATDHGVLGVRVLAGGQKTSPECYADADVIAFVKNGRARVLSEDGSVLAELEQADTILFPANTSYVIEALEGPDLELIHFYASHVTLPDTFRPFS